MKDEYITFDEWRIKKNIKTKDELINDLYEDLYNNIIYIDDFKNKLFKIENIKIFKMKKYYDRYRKEIDYNYAFNLKKKAEKFYINNTEKQKKYAAKYAKERMKIDPLFKLSITLRCRIGMAVKSKGWTKQNKTAEILGCDFETVRKHLENQFIDNMSWDNHGRWHIDHIKPLSKAETQEELYKRCHYTNLQPLWAADNLSKGAKEL